MKENTEQGDVSEKIKVFSSDDERLKVLGELLSNKSSRDIIRLLSHKEMYTNEIAKKLDMRSNLVIHYLKKLEELGLLLISEKKIVKKGNNHRYFKMIPNLFILSNETKDQIEEKGFLKKFFKDGVKFVSIGIVFFGSYVINKNYFKPNEINYPIPFGTDVPQTTLNNLEFWIIPLIVLVVALIIERIIFGIKKRKKS